MTTRVLRLADRPTLVWLVLLAATMLTAVVGLEHDPSRTAGLVLLTVAFVKLRLVGIHFMELRTAPTPLRLLF
jgi:hypothetical protein